MTHRVACRIVTAALRRAMTTRSRTTIATNPSAVRIQTVGDAAVNTGGPPSVVQDDRSEGLFRPPGGDQRNREHRRAFRDDDTAAKEYSPSSGGSVADADGPSARAQDAARNTPAGRCVPQEGRQLGYPADAVALQRRLLVEGSIPPRHGRHHELGPAPSVAPAASVVGSWPSAGETSGTDCCQ